MSYSFQPPLRLIAAGTEHHTRALQGREDNFSLGASCGKVSIVQTVQDDDMQGSTHTPKIELIDMCRCRCLYAVTCHDREFEIVYLRSNIS
jgi:hypothetical protein